MNKGKYTILAKNKIVFYRDITCFGLFLTPVIQVNLLVNEDPLLPPAACRMDTQTCNCNKSKYIQAPGYTVDLIDILNIFNETIGSEFSNKIVVEKGRCPESNQYPIKYVNFSPSSENLARYFFTILKPIIYKKLNAELLEVSIVTDLSEISYNEA